MIRVGISGWSYASWRGDFYPRGLPHSKELAYASRRVSTIEINASFYALQKPTTYLRWCEEVPEDFVFSVKAPRYITHIKKLSGCAPAIANFLASGVLGLGSKLGPLLWQCPAGLRYDRDRFERFFDLLPDDLRKAERIARRHERWMRGRVLLRSPSQGTLRHAIEVRHPSFGDPAFLDQLRSRDFALVVSHASHAWPCFAEVTSDHLVYVRLHGARGPYSGSYRGQLGEWGSRIRSWERSGERLREVFVYFDNDAEGSAPRDARALARELSLV